MRAKRFRSPIAWWCLLLLIPAGLGCAGGVTSFLQPNIDFSHIQKCALLPFRNLTSDGFADERLQSIVMTEVLRHGSLVLLDPEETVGAMKELKISLSTPPSPEQIVALGKALSVEAVFLGSVEEYGLTSGTREETNSVTLALSMAETETGNMIWRAHVHVSGSSIWKRLFGGDSAGLYDVSRTAVRRALGTLF
jgi:hypothetical protein